MTPRHLACLCLLLLPGLPADEAPVARLGQRTFAREDLARWLVDRVGVSYVRDFVAETLTLELAAERGLSPTPEELTQRYEEEFAFVLERTYGGNEARWIAALEAQGESREGWEARRRAELRLQMAAEAIVRADRQPDEELVEQRFRDHYGVDGERVALSALFFNAYRDVDPDAGRPDLTALKQAARQRAAEARDRWLAGAPLEELLADSDETAQLEIEGGRIAHYRRNMLGKEIDQAVASLDRAGEISQPVEVFDGTWVLKLDERTPVTLDQVRDELVDVLMNEPVTSGEMAEIHFGLLEQEGLEFLLR